MACLAATGTSQHKLHETARTHAMGGMCQRIMLAKDQRHALSIGKYGDLVWWDLETGTPLRHVPGRSHQVAGVAIHPQQHMAAVSWVAAGRIGSVYAVDLVTGTVRKWFDRYASVLAFAEDGELLGSSEREAGTQRVRRATYRMTNLSAGETQPAWHEPWQFAQKHDTHLVFTAEGTVTGTRDVPTIGSRKVTTSPDGNVQLVVEGNRLRIDTTKLEHEELSFELGCQVVTDNRAALVADSRGQMVAFRSPTESCPANAPHRGHADRLLFSPDGGYVAIMTLGALRIVDLAGNECGSFDGTQIATRGKDGPEFWLVTNKGARRWNAATKTFVGEPRSWRRKDIAVTRTASFDWTRRPYRFHRLGIANVSGDDAWLSGRSAKKHSSFVIKETRTQTFATTRDLLRNAVAAQPLSGTDEALLLSTSWSPLADQHDWYLERLDAKAGRMHFWRGTGAPTWFALNDSQTTAWIATGPWLYGVSTKDTKQIAFHRDTPDWHTGIAWHDDHLLVSDSHDLQVVDPKSLNLVREFDVPDDLGRIDLVAASPDRSHLAIASRSEVRIFRMAR